MRLFNDYGILNNRYGNNVKAFGGMYSENLIKMIKDVWRIIMEENATRELKENELNQLHKCLLSILKDFTYVCEKYNLRYTLGGGSVLGAVRHHGFIPWDDDLDINMPRADYEKFKNLFVNELSEEYELQVPNSLYGSTTPFMKLLKKGTVYRQQFSYLKEEFPYIWIDIFPFDFVPENKLKRFMKGHVSQILNYLFVGRYIFEHRNQTTDTYYRNYYKKKNKEWIFTVRMLLAKYCPFNSGTLFNYFDYFVQSKKESSLLTCATGRKGYLGEISDARYFEQAEDGNFEGLKVKLPFLCKNYLTRLYGNYMEIPPVEKREHHVTTEFFIAKDVCFKVNESK